jgi:hypothetical protein
MSSSRDNASANSLVENLKKLYFIGYEAGKKREIAKEAEQLVDMAKKTFEIKWGPGGAVLEIK